jgi:IclR family KDG regulon transcriptional repressor
MPSASQVRTVDRMHAILSCFSQDEPFLSLSQISERLGLSKSTTHRLLSSMVHNGFLSRMPNERTYCLGYQFMCWASIVENALDLRDLARPFLEELNRITGETAILTVRDDHWAVCLEKVESRKAVRLAMTVGSRRWLHAGASAKVLMAYLGPEAIEEAISGTGLPRIMHNTITEPQALYEELESIRALGYATSFEETDQGAMGVAAPVFDRSNRVVAGIGIAGPISRWSHDDIPELAGMVTAAARRLSAHLGQREVLIPNPDA